MVTAVLTLSFASTLKIVFRSLSCMILNKKRHRSPINAFIDSKMDTVVFREIDSWCSMCRLGTVS